MNPISKNLIIMLLFATVIFGAAFVYASTIEKKLKLPVETGRIPVSNLSGVESYGLIALQ